MISSIREQESALFAEWKSVRNYDSFTFDGVFDEEQYSIQPIKILYVLKEADWPDCKEDLYLKEYLLSEISSTYWKTWNNIARWTKALLCGGSYQDMRHVTRKEKSFWMRKIAFVELKKVPGGAHSAKDEIAAYVRNDCLFLERQIALYTPDIIICCGRGTGKNADLLYQKVFQNHSLSEWSKQPLTENKYNYFTVDLAGKTVPVVSFVHPQMRGGHTAFEKKYNDVLEIGKFFFSS